MRRLSLTLFVAAMLSLTACSSTGGVGYPGGAAPTATSAPTSATATAAAPTATSSAAGAATIGMGGFTFSGNSATVKAGQAVTFADPASGGGVHHLVTGHNGAFSAAAGAPSEFASAAGVSFSPGDSKSIVFPTAGTYAITCTIHPSMQATITVTP
jgi:plastocyanin